MAKTRTPYTVTAPRTPGATPSVIGTADTLTEARQIAAQFRHRPDLRGQDVRIDDATGRKVEYAGPAR